MYDVSLDIECWMFIIGTTRVLCASIRAHCKVARVAIFLGELKECVTMAGCIDHERSHVHT